MINFIRLKDIRENNDINQDDIANILNGIMINEKFLIFSFLFRCLELLNIKNSIRI